MHRRAFVAAAAASLVQLQRARANAADDEDRQVMTWDHMKIIDPAGRVRMLEDLGNKVLIVNLWASWCANCLREFASMKKMQATFGEENVDIVLVSYPKFWQQDQAFAKSHAIPFPVFGVAPAIPEVEWRAAFRDSGNLSLPQTLIWSGDDRVNRSVVTGGVDWMAPVVLGAIKEYVADAAANHGWPPGKRPARLITPS